MFQGLRPYNSIFRKKPFLRALYKSSLDPKNSDFWSLREAFYSEAEEVTYGEYEERDVIKKFQNIYKTCFIKIMKLL